MQTRIPETDSVMIHIMFEPDVINALYARWQSGLEPEIVIDQLTGFVSGIAVAGEDGAGHGPIAIRVRDLALDEVKAFYEARRRLARGRLVLAA